jgi:hypothetical protein
MLNMKRRNFITLLGGARRGHLRRAHERMRRIRDVAK